MTYLLLIIMIGVLGSLARDGLWSNLITLLNVVTAALLATSYFEPVADILTGMAPSLVHYWGLLALGLLFGAVFILLRTITGKLSRFRVRFHPPVDNFVGAFTALLVGWTAVMFVCFAMHLAPLSRNFLNGSFDPEQRMFFSLAPDRMWLGFVQKLSNNGSWGRNVVSENGQVMSMFDPRSEFMIKYASRRAWLDTQPATAFPH